MTQTQARRLALVHAMTNDHSIPIFTTLAIDLQRLKYCLFTTYLPIFMVAGNVHGTFLNRWQASPHQRVAVAVTGGVRLRRWISAAGTRINTVIAATTVDIGCRRGSTGVVRVTVHKIVIDIGDILQDASVGSCA